MGQNSGWHSSDCPGKGKQRPGLRQENMTEEKLGCLGEWLGGRGENVVIVEEKTWKGPRDFHPECILLTFSQIKGFLQSLCFGHRKVWPRASVQCPGGRLPQGECTGSWLVDLVLGEINLTEDRAMSSYSFCCTGSDYELHIKITQGSFKKRKKENYAWCSFPEILL